MIELSKEVFVAADSSKFGRDVTIAIAPLDKIDAIVTDNLVDRSYAAKFKRRRRSLLLRTNSGRITEQPPNAKDFP